MTNFPPQTKHSQNHSSIKSILLSNPFQNFFTSQQRFHVNFILLNYQNTLLVNFTNGIWKLSSFISSFFISQNIQVYHPRTQPSLFTLHLFFSILCKYLSIFVCKTNWYISIKRNLLRKFCIKFCLTYFWKFLNYYYSWKLT
jgi:hypothetical protein